jgi:hypothetical protein
MEVGEKPPVSAPVKALIKPKGKKIGLKQLQQKVFKRVAITDERLKATLGNISDAFDLILFGSSGSGKSNLAAVLIKELVKAFKCKCTLVSYEEGHEATLQDTLINRHNLLNELGNTVQIWDHLTFDELCKEMSRRKSAKLWVIDSIQTSFFTAQQCEYLRSTYVLGKKKKIIIWVSWADGDTAKGAVGKSVQYWAAIKIQVKKRIAFVISNRFGGKKNYIIDDEAARRMWTVKDYNKHKKG